MRKFIFFFLGMFFPQQAAAITQIVNAGEVLDGGDVHTVVTQRVYGTTKNFTVSGNQQVMSGGEAYNSNMLKKAAFPIIRMCNITRFKTLTGRLILQPWRARG